MEAIHKENFMWEKHFVTFILKISIIVVLFKLQYNIHDRMPWLVSRSCGLGALGSRK